MPLSPPGQRMPLSSVIPASLMVRWAVVAALVLLVVGALVVTVREFGPSERLPVDSGIYRNALEGFLAGREVYLVPDAEATAEAGKNVYFFPPPTAAIVGGTLAAFAPTRQAMVVITISVLLVGFVLVWSLTGWASRPTPATAAGRRRRALTFAGAALGWFAFIPVLQVVGTGNQNDLLLVALAAFATGIVRRRTWLAGFALGASVLLKPSAGLFVLPLLVAGYRREVLVAGAVASVGVAMSVPVLGWEPWVDFVRALIAGNAHVADQGTNLSPLAWLLPRLSLPVAVTAVAFATAAAGRLPAREMLAASIAIFLVAWPVLWVHYGVLALLAIALLHGSRGWSRATLVAYPLFAIPAPATWLLGGAALLVGATRPARERICGWLEQSEGPVRSPDGHGPESTRREGRQRRLVVP